MGRFPCWKFKDGESINESKVKLDKDVSFASDMRVVVKNVETTLINVLGLSDGTIEKEIGYFSVPIKSL
jgi:hypothetical protein